MGPFLTYLPTYPSPIFSYRNHCFSIAISDFWKPTYLPKNGISFVDAPYVGNFKPIIDVWNIILTHYQNYIYHTFDRWYVTYFLSVWTTKNSTSLPIVTCLECYLFGHVVCSFCWILSVNSQELLWNRSNNDLKKFEMYFTLIKFQLKN